MAALALAVLPAGRRLRVRRGAVGRRTGPARGERRDRLRGARRRAEPSPPPAPARRRGALPYGFNDHAGLVGTIPIAEDAELQERAGSTLWRVAIDWRFAEPERGEVSLETHDAIYCEGLARGIRPIFHITGTPEWAADPGGCPVVSCLYPPRSSALDELSEFAALVAERYPRAAAIEAWNEPNLATFWAVPDPERYVEVLAAIDDGVESTGSSIPVLGGSLSNTSRTDDSRAATSGRSCGGCSRRARPSTWTGSPSIPTRSRRSARRGSASARRWLGCGGPWRQRATARRADLGHRGRAPGRPPGSAPATRRGRWRGSTTRLDHEPESRR